MVRAVVKEVCVLDALIPEDAMQQFRGVVQHQIVLVTHFNQDFEAACANGISPVGGHSDGIVCAEMTGIPMCNQARVARTKFANVPVDVFVGLCCAFQMLDESCAG